MGLGSEIFQFAQIEQELQSFSSMGVNKKIVSFWEVKFFNIFQDYTPSLKLCITEILTDSQKLFLLMHTPPYRDIHVGGLTPSITMGGNFRPQPERNLVYGNGTEEDYNITKVWNEILNKANLTEDQVKLKDSILSNKRLGLQPNSLDP